MIVSAMIIGIMEIQSKEIVFHKIRGDVLFKALQQNVVKHHSTNQPRDENGRFVQKQKMDAMTAHLKEEIRKNKLAKQTAEVEQAEREGME